MRPDAVPEWARGDFAWLQSRWGKSVTIGFDRKAGKFTATAGIGELIGAEQFAQVLDAQLADRSVRGAMDAAVPKVTP